MHVSEPLFVGLPHVLERSFLLGAELLPARAQDLGHLGHADAGVLR